MRFCEQYRVRVMETVRGIDTLEPIPWYRYFQLILCLLVVNYQLICRYQFQRCRRIVPVMVVIVVVNKIVWVILNLYGRHNWSRIFILLNIISHIAYNVLLKDLHKIIVQVYTQNQNTKLMQKLLCCLLVQDFKTLIDSRLKNSELTTEHLHKYDQLTSIIIGIIIEAIGCIIN